MNTCANITSRLGSKEMLSAGCVMCQESVSNKEASMRKRRLIHGEWKVLKVRKRDKISKIHYVENRKNKTL